MSRHSLVRTRFPKAIFKSTITPGNLLIEMKDANIKSLLEDPTIPFLYVKANGTIMEKVTRGRWWDMWRRLTWNQEDNPWVADDYKNWISFYLHTWLWEKSNQKIGSLSFGPTVADEKLRKKGESGLNYYMIEARKPNQTSEFHINHYTWPFCIGCVGRDGRHSREVGLKLIYTGRSCLSNLRTHFLLPYPTSKGKCLSS
jgi:hypothetical protein